MKNKYGCSFPEREEETDASSSRKRSASLNAYFSAMKKYPLLTKEQEVEYAEAIKNGSQKALNKLVEGNLRLVVKLANRMCSKYNLELEDLIQEGNKGLIRAAKTFDPAKASFSTYATLWIKQQMCRAVEEQRSNIRSPSGAQSLYHRIEYELDQFKSRKGRLPHQPVKYLAKILKKDTREIERVLELVPRALHVQSLEHLGSKCREEMVSSLDLNEEKQTDLEEQIFSLEVEQKKEKLFLCLSKREQLVLEKYYGLIDDGEETLESIGKQLKLSHERIRQIKNKALQKLREKLSEDADLSSVFLEYLQTR